MNVSPEQESSTPVGHTPGPWEIKETAEGIEIRMGSALNDSSHWEPQHKIVIEDDYDVEDEHELAQYEEAWANARLISAAPTLLAALKQAQVELRILQSAIQCGEPWTATLDNSYRIMREQILAALAAATSPQEPGA